MISEHPGRSSGDAGIGGRRAMPLALAALFGALAFVGVLAPPASAAPGDLDTTFGSGGIVANSTGNPVDVAVQSDGKIVAVGKHEVCEPSGGGVVCHNEFLVERFNENGTLDTSFGGGDGIVTTSFGHETQRASSIVIEPGGKLLVSGDAGGEFALARYNSDGSFDTSFGGSDGEVTADVPNTSGFRSWSGSMALLPSGKIVLGGNVFANEPEVAEPWHMAVARFTTSGSLDTSFGTNGTTVGPRGNMYGLAADASGRLLAAGWSNYEFTVARFNADGSLDTSFGNAGMVSLDLSESGSKAADVLVQPDGKILVSGYGVGMTLARFNENGSLDTLFGGGDGIATPTFASPCCDIGSAIALALQPDGRIVFAGQLRPSENEFKDEWAVARLYSNGVPDKSFGAGGLVTNAFEGGAYENYASGAALQADGKIVAVGSSGSPNYDFGMMRFLGGGTAPQPSYHQFLVTKAGSGSGRVFGPELYCGVNCAADYEAGETVEVRAEGEYVEEGSEWTQVPFTGWTTISGNPGTCTGTTTPCEVTMSGDVELQATFAGGSAIQHTLTVNKGGSGSGTVTSSPSGINCGSTCSHAFDGGTMVTLTATPAAGSAFAGWSGGGCLGAGSCQIALNADTEVTATFSVEGSGGSGGSGESVMPPPPASSPTPKPRKPLKCRKGFKKRRVHGKRRCVKVKRHQHRQTNRPVD